MTSSDVTRYYRYSVCQNGLHCTAHTKHTRVNSAFPFFLTPFFLSFFPFSETLTAPPPDDIQIPRLGLSGLFLFLRKEDKQKIAEKTKKGKRQGKQPAPVLSYSRVERGRNSSSGNGICYQLLLPLLPLMLLDDKKASILSLHKSSH